MQRKNGAYYVGRVDRRRPVMYGGTPGSRRDVSYSDDLSLKQKIGLGIATLGAIAAIGLYGMDRLHVNDYRGGWNSHALSKGETLWKIAEGCSENTGKDPRDWVYVMREKNRIDDPGTLQVGQKVLVPEVCYKDEKN